MVHRVCGLPRCNESINLTLLDSCTALHGLKLLARTALKVKLQLTLLFQCFLSNPSADKNTSTEPVWWFRILNLIFVLSRHTWKFSKVNIPTQFIFNILIFLPPF